MPESYRPSNGTEGEAFMDQFCEQCSKYAGGCEIQMRTMAYDIGDPEYPSEWTYGEHGPTCTAYTAKYRGDDA